MSLDRLTTVLAVALLLLPAGFALACGAGSPSPYAGTFFDNDFSYLEAGCTPEDDGRDAFSRLTDRTKRLSLGDDITADFGGEFRLRYHDETNLGLSRLDGLDDSFFLTRLRLYGDLEVGPHLRVYAEMVDARSHGEEFGPRGVEEVHTDLLNGFVEVRAPLRGADLGLRVGRQELLFGAQRLISPLDWGNTRRSFDGVRLDGRLERVDLSAWVAAPRQITSGFSSRTDDNNLFSGLYGTWHPVDGMIIDGYVLNLASDLPDAWDRDLWTVGGRHAGTLGGLFWEVEAAGQFGQSSGGAGALDNEVRAWMFTAGAGYRFSGLPWEPVLSLLYDRASGDSDPEDGTLGTFNQLFPLAHAYLGFADLVGRQNIEAVSLRLGLKPHPRLTLGLTAHRFWLADARDALYNAGGAPIRRDENGSSGRDVGTELDITATAQLLDRVDLQVGYSRFWGGDFVDATNPAGVSGNADFFYAQVRARF